MINFVQQNIKYDTVQKFSAPLSRTRLQSSGLEGFNSSEIIVTTKCDLQTFVSMFEPLMNTPESADQSLYHFNPSKSAFSNQSRATQLLSVDFMSVGDLLKWMSIRDAADLHTMSVKSTVRKNDALLRLLGTSTVIQVVTDEKVNCTVDVDCILPLSSCTSHHRTVLRSRLCDLFRVRGEHTPSTEKLPQVNQAKGDNLVFFRRRQNFDDAQGRYLSPWKSLYFNLDDPVTNPTKSTATESKSLNTSLDSLFSIQWSQCKPLPSTMWTSDATFLGLNILGDLTVFFPAITFFGSSTIKEVQQLTSDNILS